LSQVLDLVGQDFDPYEEWPFQDEDRHFCSGVNAPGEVRGLLASAQHIGIVADNASEPLLTALDEAAYAPCLTVFVDSGAFSEVSFDGGGRRVVKPITASEWRRRFAVYSRVAKAYGDRAYLVAPDAVGDQAETLARLETYAADVRALRDIGAQVIVAMQRGALDAPTFVAHVAQVLGFGDFILGIPSKKNATTAWQLFEDCRALYLSGYEGDRFHLLGMGPSSSRWDAQRDAVRDWFPEAAVFSDAVGARREVGRTNGTGGKPRRLTAAQDAARARGLSGSDVKAAAVAELGHGDQHRRVQAARRAGWFDPELESAPGVPLEPGCIEYGAGGPFGLAHTEQPKAAGPVQTSLPVDLRWSDLRPQRKHGKAVADGPQADLFEDDHE
jgi:hypothetical protein